MLLTDPVADLKVGLPTPLIWGVVLLEIAAAYTNWMSRNAALVALLNICLFGTFGIFAAFRWTQGFASCGCTGSISVPPWVFLLIDFAIVSWFVVFKFWRREACRGAINIIKIWNSRSQRMRGLVAGVASFFVLGACLQFPMLAWLNASVFLNQPIKSVAMFNDKLRFESTSVGKVAIYNSSTTSARIVGLWRSCNCLELEDPHGIVIPANGECNLEITVQPIAIGQLRQRAVLFLDHPNQFRLNVNVSGFVDEGKKE